MQKNKIKVIGFDLWNTLIYNKNKKIWKDFKNFITNKLGKSYLELLFRKNITIEQISHDIAVYSSKRDVKTFTKYIKIRKKNMKKYKDFDITYELKQNYKIGIISNTTCITKQIIKETQWFNHFDFIFLSCDLNILKPDKKIFQQIFEIYKYLKKEEMLFIGDNYKIDYLGAKDFGIKALLLDRRNKTNMKEKIKTLYSLRKLL